MDRGALDGVVAVELAESVSAAYCGKLLADLGARVVMVEAPSGHPLRRRGSTPAGAPYSGLFAYLALNKESVVLSSASTDESAMRALLEGADVLITDGTSEVRGVVVGTLPEHLIQVDVSPFGRTGPYSAWRSTEFTTWAMGGYMSFTGEKGREPLALAGAQSEFHCGAHAAFAALAGLHARGRDGLGQQVEVSALESVLSAHSWLTVAWSHSGTVLERTSHDFTRCKDGWVCFMRGVMYPALFLMIGRPELIEDPRWGDLPGWAAHLGEIYELVGGWCLTRTRQEIVDAAQELRIACLPLNDARDLDQSAQLKAREWWIAVDEDGHRSLRLPGFPYRLSATAARVRRPAPLPGEHESLPEPAPAPTSARRASSATRLQALTGLRVIEVTSNWAGPVCGRHLADLGADVIKVESPTRPATRGGFWPHGDPQRQGYNRAGYFNHMNRNKRDVVLDLASAEGHRLFVDLVRRADVLIENNSARVMPNLGLSWEALAIENPRLVMVSISGSGGTGPERDYVAYGSTVEASSGLAALVGYDDSQPYRTGSYYADPVAGIHAAVAILAALEHRRRAGVGQWIDVSLTESCAAFFAEALIEYQVTGEVPHRQGNRSPLRCPQGAYRCAGVDNWLAVSVSTDDEWRRLCAAIGRTDLLRLDLATLGGRLARAEEIEEAVGQWAAPKEQYEAAWELQRAGVASAPVLANWQHLADPHLFARGFYVPIVHPIAGVYPYPSWPWRFSRTPATVSRAAPLFGEHNRGVLSELGVGEVEMASLYERRVVSDAPVVG